MELLGLPRLSGGFGSAQLQRHGWIWISCSQGGFKELGEEDEAQTFFQAALASLPLLRTEPAPLGSCFDESP